MSTKHLLRHPCVPAFLLLLCLAPTASLVAQEPQSAARPAELGELVPDHSFPNPKGSGGRTRLVDWFGHPVLVFGWKTHLLEGMHAARPAYEMQQKLGGKGLVLIGVDRNQWRAGAGDEAVTFWLSTAGLRLFLTSVPSKARAKDLPIRWPVPRDARSAVLIGVDGRLRAVGSMEDLRAKRAPFRRQLQQLVAKEVQKRRKGWGDHPLARQARALCFGKDQVGKALAALAEAPPEAVECAQARAEVLRHLESRLRQVIHLRDSGALVEADRAVRSLRKSVGKFPAALERAKPVFDSLQTASAKKLLEVDRKLEKLLAPVLGTPRKGRAKAEVLGRLRRFAKQHAANPVGQRAASLERQVHSMLCGLLGKRWKEIEAAAGQ